ncbi:MAG: hypothetical protein IPL61_07510 [Myxococcales bacterium]|nr:hypothetical protein [Myxococcales bacterium]
MLRSILVRMVPLAVVACTSTADPAGDGGGGCGSSTQGNLGVGSFSAVDCTESDCLAVRALAANSRERLIFDGTYEPVRRIESSDPGVVRIDAMLTQVDEETRFDVTAVAPGQAELIVHGADVIDRLTVTVAEVGQVELRVTERIAEGGLGLVTSSARGVDGAPRIGRGGSTLTVPPGLTALPADLGTGGLFLSSEGPAYELRADVPGAYAVSSDHTAAGWSAPVEVIAADRIVRARVDSTGFMASSPGGFLAFVFPQGLDDAGADLVAVPCAWTTSRPVALTALTPIGVIVASATADPVTLTCTYDQRVLGSVVVAPAT